ELEGRPASWKRKQREERRCPALHEARKPYRDAKQPDIDRQSRREDERRYEVEVGGLQEIACAAEERDGARPDHLPRARIAIGEPQQRHGREPGQGPDVVVSL